MDSEKITEVGRDIKVESKQRERSNLEVEYDKEEEGKR